MYRSGAATQANLTPRPDTDVPDGLSTHETLESITKAGEKAQVIDVAKLMHLEAWRDPDGHVSLRPSDPDELKTWAATKAAAKIQPLDPPHPLTKELSDAIVDETKRAKATP